MTQKKPLETPEDLTDFMDSEGDPAGDVLEGTASGEAAVPPGVDSMEAADTFEEEEKEGGDMLQIASDIPVQVVAVMGKKNITLKEIASLKMGMVVELGRPANEVVDLVAGGKLIARGELVDIDGKLGVRIVTMIR